MVVTCQLGNATIDHPQSHGSGTGRDVGDLVTLDEEGCYHCGDKQAPYEGQLFLRDQGCSSFQKTTKPVRRGTSVIGSVIPYIGMYYVHTALSYTILHARSLPTRV